MKKNIDAYITAVGKIDGIEAVIGEDEIVADRVRVRIFDDMLFCEFPVDSTPAEIVAAAEFIVALVGLDSFQPLMNRMKKSLHSGQDHFENVGNWSLACSERGSFQTIEARYRTSF